MKRKRVLITGGEGFIGRNLREALPEADVLDLKSGQDIRTFQIKKKYDIIYHLAAQTDIKKSFENPLEIFSHNVLGTLKVLEYAKKTKAKIIFASSAAVYWPITTYGLQKRQCEEWLGYYWNFGVKSIVLRLFNVFGKYQEIANSGYSLVISKFLKQKKEGKPFTIYGDGKQRRDFVGVDDVVEAMIRAGEYLEGSPYFLALDIGSGKNYSVNDLAEMIYKNNKKVYLPFPYSEPKTTTTANIIVNNKIRKMVKKSIIFLTTGK